MVTTCILEHFLQLCFLQLEWQAQNIGNKTKYNRWALLVDSLHEQEPDFACIYMATHQDFLNHGYNGCGTTYAYLFYISFHLIFSLMILNLFIASIIGAYEEHVKQEESAISKY